MKDVVLLILEAVMLDFKRRCEKNTDKKSSDIYGKWYDQIKIMYDTIKNGGIK